MHQPGDTVRRTVLLGWILLGGLLCGCAGYRLGPTNNVSARTQSIFVEVFGNETLQPFLQDEFTEALRIGLQRDGTYRLGHRGDCDIIVQGVIKDYTREGLSFDPDNLVQVRDYTVIAVAHVNAYERFTGAQLLDQDVAGSTQVRYEQDMSSAERQASPLLAENVTKKIVGLLVDGTW